MSDLRPVALQLAVFSPHLEAGLSRRFEVVRWFELDATAQASVLQAQAPRVRAVVTAGQVGCSNALMSALPQLGVIAINGVGVDRVDLDFARARGVRVTTTPGTLTEDVADLAVGLLIALLRAIPAADAFVREGAWQAGEWPLARKVSGLDFGILGLGQIGRAIAARLAVFGRVAYSGPHRKDVPYEFHPQPITLARSCDVLVVSCPATPATFRLVDGRILDALGPQGYLINVARGSIVDESALIAALAAGRIAGAALDVFEREPTVPEALRRSSRVVLTPHLASATVETRTAMADLVLANLDAYLDSRPLPSAVA